MSLHLGNEIFEIQDQKAISNLHLFTRQGASLQAQSAFERKFAFRPHSTDTLTHRKMTMNMADKSNRTQKVKLVTDVGINPEKSRSVIYLMLAIFTEKIFRRTSREKTNRFET
jgi:RNA polymerase-associated protein LEO1